MKMKDKVRTSSFSKDASHPPRTFMLKPLAASLVMALSFSMVHGEALKTEMDKVSHIIGHNIGTSLQDIDGLNMEVFIQGLKDAKAGKEPQIGPQEGQMVMAMFQQKMQEKMQTKAAAAGQKNIEEGKAYLAANAKKEGVKVTESGLQYKVIKSGTGEKPKSTDTVEAHYHGTLIDGTTFDSSYDRGSPASFAVTGVIKGWVEALQMMKVGDIWELTIPSELAYGANPRPGGPIGPNAVLNFKVELISIK